MRRSLLIGVAAVAVAVGGLGAWRLLHGGDPIVAANRRLAAGDLHGAELLLRAAVADDPSGVRAHAALAEVELRANDPAGAEREAGEAARRGYDPNKAAVLLAEAMVGQKQYARVLTDAVVRPGMAPQQQGAVLVQRAIAQQALDHGTEARATILQALALDPHGYAENMEAAELDRAAGDTASAGAHVDAALTASPGSLQALMLRGALYTTQGDPVRALATYDNAVTVSRGAEVALLTRADLRSLTGDAKGARADVDAVLHRSPQSPLANFLLMRLLGSAGDWHGADAALARATPVLEIAPRGLYLAAIVKMNVQQPDQALDDAQRYFARATGPEHLQAARLLATVQLSSGNAAGALAVLEPFAAQADAGALQLLAVAYSRAGNQPQAIATLTRAAALSPADPAITHQLAALRADPDAAKGSVPGLDAAAILKANLSAPGPIAPAGSDQVTVAANAVLQAVATGNGDAADAALGRLRVTPGVNPGQLDLLTGMVRLAHTDLAGARTSFAAAGKELPNNPAPKVELARVMALQGDVAGAEAILAPMADAAPANLAVLNSLILLLIDQGKTADAMTRLDAAHAAAPADAAIAVTIAQLAARAGQPLKALGYVALPGTQPLGLLAMRSQLQMQTGRYKDAVATLRIAHTAAPRDPAVAQALISALLAVGDTDGASQVADGALAADPANAGLLGSQIAIAEHRGGVDAALARADALMQTEADRPASLPLKGDLLMALRRVPQAVTAYQDAMAMAPSSLLVVRLAAAMQTAGQTDQAASLLQDWLAKHPDDADAGAALGSIEVGRGNMALARARLETALRSHPDDPGALNNLALVEQAAGNLPHARSLAQHAYLRQSAPQVADTLGWIIASQGDAADALPLLRQASLGAPTDPGMLYHLAVALNAAGKKSEALATLKRLLTDHPAFQDRTAATALQAKLSP